jgi:hypothetical protein
MTDALDDGELRARSAAVRAEWRDDEEAWTRAAFEHWEHRRTLVDIVRDCMMRADEVILKTPHLALRGVITAVGRDALRIIADGHSGDNGQDAATDVQLTAGGTIALRVVGRTRSGSVSDPRRGRHDDATFRARLLERETLGQVELGSFASADVLVGELRVGADHVRLRSPDVGDSYVPMSSVAWVRNAGS